MPANITVGNPRARAFGRGVSLGTTSTGGAAGGAPSGASSILAARARDPKWNKMGPAAYRDQYELTGHGKSVTDAVNAGETVQPWAPSSGAGPGTRGYEGSGHSYGYSAQNQGTADDKFRQWGGMSPPRASLLNDLYRNQPGQTMGAFDKLQSRKAMDEADPNSAFFADQMGVAGGAGNTSKAAFMQQMLQDRLAMQQASGGVGTANGAGDASDWVGDTVAALPGGPPQAAPIAKTGPLHSWEEARGVAPIAQQQPAEPTWVGGENLGEGNLYTPYGTASVSQDAIPTTFTNAHDSAGPGGVHFTGPKMGRQTAREFFGDRADFTHEPNAYATPSPGYDGRRAAYGYGQNKGGNSKAWGAYHAAMAAKKKLAA